MHCTLPDTNTTIFSRFIVFILTALILLTPGYGFTRNTVRLATGEWPPAIDSEAPGM